MNVAYSNSSYWFMQNTFIQNCNFNVMIIRFLQDIKAHRSFSLLKYNSIGSQKIIASFSFFLVKYFLDKMFNRIFIISLAVAVLAVDVFGGQGQIFSPRDPTGTVYSTKMHSTPI